MSSPFAQQQSFGEFCQDMENERQDMFERRVVDAIFKQAGCPAYVMKIVRKKVNTGSDQECMSIGWFNQYAGFPFFVGTRRFARDRAFDDMALGLTSPSAHKMVEAVTLADLQESSPDMPAVLITRYPKRGYDMVLHTQEHPCLHKDDWMIQRKDLMIVEPLSMFMAYVVEQHGWEPSQHLPVTYREEGA
jgi:hypothetical protein